MNYQTSNLQYKLKISEQLLLVATGSMVNVTGTGINNNLGTTDQSQIMDINSPSSTCSNLQPFPYAMYGGAGGVLNGHPVICGGRIGGSKCTEL